jgi:hypothetical protein
VAAGAAQLTGILKAHGLGTEANGWPPGMRVIVRHDRTPARSRGYLRGPV